MRTFSVSLARFASTALMTVLTACNTSVTAPPVTIPPADHSVSSFRSHINNIIVIYEENWSFDGLFAHFPGANGATGPTNQVYCQNGTTAYTPLTAMPAAYQSAPSANGCTWNGSQSGTVLDPKITPTSLSPSSTYALESYVTPSYITGDIIHRFWHEQLQIDNGVLEPAVAPYSNDKVVTWSDNQGLTLSTFDTTNLPEGKLAQQYVLADNFYQSAYGGSYLNHQFLICACAPVFTGTAPSSAISTYDATTKTLNDGALTYYPIGNTGGPLYTVNTIQPTYAPTAGGLEVPPLTNKTIGDLLTDNTPSISWKWYAGGWTAALQNPNLVYAPPAEFQSHHQPFNYYQRWGTGGATQGSHLQDETQFFTDLQQGTLPQVSFIKPVGVNNEHPGYSDILDSQNHLMTLVQAVENSSYWSNSVIVITHDEFGGRWDHVTIPPVAADGFGPGSRIPAIIVSPYAVKHLIDHTQNETVSILKMIETRFNLPNLTARDAAAGNLLETLDFSQFVPPSKTAKKPGPQSAKPGAPANS